MTFCIAYADWWELFWAAFEAIGTWFAALAAIFIGCVAVFQDRIRDFVFYPNGELICGNDGCFFQRASPDDAPEKYALRLKITNMGKAMAEDVECHLLAVHLIAEGAMESFIPVRLKWTHLQKGDRIQNEDLVLKHLAHSASRFIDLGVLVAPRLRTNGPAVPTIFLATEVDGANSFARLNPGRYALDIAVTSKQRVLSRATFELSFTGMWETPWYGGRDNGRRANYEISRSHLLIGL